MPDLTPDERIAADIRMRLEQHEMIDASRISVSVADGVVKLVGTATNRFVRHRAEDLASDVEGVKKIVNTIGIQPSDVEPGPVLSTNTQAGHKGGSTQRS